MAGEVFKPNGKHVHWYWPSWVTKAVLYLSAILRGIDQKAEFMSNVEKNLQFLVFSIKSPINGNGCDCGTTSLFKFRKSMHNLDFLPSSFL